MFKPVKTARSILLPLAMGIAQAASAQAALDAVTVARIDTVFAGAANRVGPGYAVGVVKNGRVLYAAGYGSANLDDGIAISPETAFHLASLSKQFTGSAIALLALDGKLRLDDPVEKYIPDARRYGPSLQIRHLVYMTSGLVDYTAVRRPNGAPWFSDSYFDIDDALRASLSQPLQFAPGTQWAYRNINFMLLARIVENVSGQSLAQFLKNRMFDPLGMSQTLVDDDSTQVIAHRAVGYAPRTAQIVDELHKVGIKARADGDWVRLNRVSPHYGGSGVFSSVADLAKWEGNFDHPKVGGADYVALMYRTAKFEHPKANDAFGLVWRDFHGLRFLDYAGEDLDANTYMAHFPDSHLAIICLSNMLTGDCESKAHSIMETLFSTGILGAP
jgi:CubicO group peptidase (beta-lactamase class C family)